ncbi:DNA-binding transcriptional regulator, MarR family [Fulvimarina manganoxydans]|uniref:DNA-binding transcriptional regulator, MarR family n=2 Tax=Fulvimarina manganoxydans TaxID=937218 RepID=A0A1W2C8S7_9HYPH|nr:DNA-binding transcriptional regulator, MarR family [Fulvimarina manganoxydans]
MSSSAQQPNISAAASPQSRAFVPSLVNIMKSGRALITLRLAEIGLHSGQDHLLVALDPNGAPQLVSQLAEATGVRASTTSKMLDRLELKGLVTRRSDGPDRRHTMVSLTPEGIALRAEVETLWENVEAYIMRGCADGEEEDVRHAASRLDALMTERLRRLR